MLHCVAPAQVATGHVVLGGRDERLERKQPAARPEAYSPQPLAELPDEEAAEFRSGASALDDVVLQREAAG